MNDDVREVYNKISQIKLNTTKLNSSFFHNSDAYILNRTLKVVGQRADAEAIAADRKKMWYLKTVHCLLASSAKKVVPKQIMRKM